MLPGAARGLSSPSLSSCGSRNGSCLGPASAQRHRLVLQRGWKFPLRRPERPRGAARPRPRSWCRLRPSCACCRSVPRPCCRALMDSRGAAPQECRRAAGEGRLCPPAPLPAPQGQARCGPWHGGLAAGVGNSLRVWFIKETLFCEGPNVDSTYQTHHGAKSYIFFNLMHILYLPRECLFCDVILTNA